MSQYLTVMWLLSLPCNLQNHSVINYYELFTASQKNLKGKKSFKVHPGRKEMNIFFSAFRL